MKSWVGIVFGAVMMLSTAFGAAADSAKLSPALADLSLFHQAIIHFLQAGDTDAAREMSWIHRDMVYQVSGDDGLGARLEARRADRRPPDVGDANALRMWASDWALAASSPREVAHMLQAVVGFDLVSKTSMPERNWDPVIVQSLDRMLELSLPEVELNIATMSDGPSAIADFIIELRLGPTPVAKRAVSLWIDRLEVIDPYGTDFSFASQTIARLAAAARRVDAPEDALKAFETALRWLADAPLESVNSQREWTQAGLFTYTQLTYGNALDWAGEIKALVTERSRTLPATLTLEIEYYLSQNWAVKE